jgi:hypothetical protein
MAPWSVAYLLLELNKRPGTVRRAYLEFLCALERKTGKRNRKKCRRETRWKERVRIQKDR